jgi:hypothetical protein
MRAIKDKGLEFFTLFDQLPQGREVALARTKTEEAVMWVRSKRAPLVSDRGGGKINDRHTFSLWYARQ